MWSEVQVKNIEIVWQFRELADLLEFKGEDFFKIRAYRQAARIMAGLEEPVEELYRRDALGKLPGIGKNILAKTKELIDTGKMRKLEELRREIPPGLLEIMALPGIGPKRARFLHARLGVTSLDELAEAARQKRVRALKGLGAKTEQDMLRHIEMLRRRSGRILLGVARELAAELADCLREAPGVARVTVSGEVRRWRETVSSITLLAVAAVPGQALETLLHHPRTKEVLAREDHLLRVFTWWGVPVELTVVPEEEYGYALLHDTGSPAHYRHLQQLAAEKGWLLTRRGLAGAGDGGALETDGDWRGGVPVAGTDASGGGKTAGMPATGTDMPAVRETHGAPDNGEAADGGLAHGMPAAGNAVPGEYTAAGEAKTAGNWWGGLPVAEAAVYRRLGLPPIPPELREDRGEIEAAAAGRLPRLVELGDIKGDLHVHSDWSDGANTIPQLVQRAREKGYHYMAVTDHSRSLNIAHGLSLERLKEQHELIERLNEELEDFRILTGVEVDILTRGGLDYPDEVLEQIDVVVASVHSGFRQDKETLTNRVLDAVKNEHVDIIGHLTGRLLGQREPYALDVERVLEEAGRNGKILEINSSPDRLDLNPEHARLARDCGARLSIDTDAHDLNRLDEMIYGVSVARRAWLEKDDLVNTLELPDLLKVLGRGK
ncbi:PHP domain-containing protein [Desulfotomaculum copahuensis]|uniref:PHP domain-containing protein n=1 Tax=Desulfotomaculum copahuensis TaxID=1838280 RepID=UPI00098E8BAE|nr:PHP domain-containing protein [Desulfotomaculum copahuensis]